MPKIEFVGLREMPLEELLTLALDSAQLFVHRLMETIGPERERLATEKATEIVHAMQAGIDTQQQAEVWLIAAGYHWHEAAKGALPVLDAILAGPQHIATPTSIEASVPAGAVLVNYGKKGEQ